MNSPVRLTFDHKSNPLPHISIITYINAAIAAYKRATPPDPKIWNAIFRYYDAEHKLELGIVGASIFDEDNEMTWEDVGAALEGVEMWVKEREKDEQAGTEVEFAILDKEGSRGKDWEGKIGEGYLKVIQRRGGGEWAGYYD